MGEPELMKIVTKQELISILETKKGAFPATIYARTVPEMLKTNNPFLDEYKNPKIQKENVANVMLNYIYENSVNRQREREGKETDFEAEPRKWGTRIAKTPFVNHKGKLYLETKIQKSISTVFKFNGVEIPRETIEKFLRKGKEGARQEVDNPVILRDYDLDNIYAITFGGEQYVVKKDLETV